MRISEIEELPNLVEYTPEIGDVINNLFIGPQGQLLENIDRLNRNYSISLGVTKNFTFKPGAYKEVKDAYTRFVLRWDMKPSGMQRLFDRHAQWEWRKSGFKREICTIEDQMKELRNNGLIWQDNAEDFNVEWERLINHTNNELEQVNQLFPHINYKIKLGQKYHTRNDYRRNINSYTSPNLSEIDASNRLYLIAYLEIEEGMDMTIHNTLATGNIVHDVVPMPRVIIVSAIDILQALTRCWKKDYSTSSVLPRNTNISSHGFCISDHLRHPYISGNVRKTPMQLEGDHEFECYDGNICRGNMDTDIKASLTNFQFLSYFMHSDHWLRNYFIPQTGPINNIGSMFIGNRNFHPETMARIVDRTNIRTVDSCGYIHDIVGSIRDYAYNSSDFSYRRNPTDFTRAEIFNRYESYLRTYDFDNLQCNQCTLQSECHKYRLITITTGMEEPTPEEQVFLGIIQEYRELLRDGIEDAVYPEVGMYYHTAFKSFLTGRDLHITFTLAYHMEDNRDCGIEEMVEDDEWADNFYNMCFIMPEEQLIEHAVREIGKEMVENLLGMEIEYAFANVDEKLIDRIVTERMAASLEVEIERVVDDVFPDLEDISPEERTLRWATQLGGGTQNL